MRSSYRQLKFEAVWKSNIGFLLMPLKGYAEQHSNYFTSRICSVQTSESLFMWLLWESALKSVITDTHEACILQDGPFWGI
jgi:hypothetical protein